MIELNFNITVALLLLLITIFIASLSIQIVPQQQAWIIERLGKYQKTLNPGMSIIIPFIDHVSYKHTLKEKAINVTRQSAITKDNVTLALDGIVYVRIVDAQDASYGVENPYYAVTQLAQTSMRSAIGKLVMDKTFEERDYLNNQIVTAINDAASTWGIKCMRYEIRDINPPNSILKAMEAQVSAERQKRAEIMQSEGRMRSMINIAEGKKKELILKSEAQMSNIINNSKGESQAIENIAKSTSNSIKNIAQSIIMKGGPDAVSMNIAQQYIDAFQKLAKINNTLIIPADAANINSMVSQIASIYNNIKK